MSRLSTSLKIYLGLVLALAVSNAIQVLLPSYQTGPGMPATLPVSIYVIALANFGIAIVIYGGLGFAGRLMWLRLGFVDLWDPEIGNRQRFLIPLITGAVLGVILILLDVLFSNFNGIGRLPHPEFPSSIFASLSAGIGEEIIFRLVFISFWMWLFSNVLFKGNKRSEVFWAVSLASAVVFAAGHLPTVMVLFNYSSLTQISLPLYLEIMMLNGLMSIFAAYYMRQYGFLAAVGVHFWTDFVWHVIWGLF